MNTADKDALHAAILMLPFQWELGDGDRGTYNRGFRDARHAAAELVSVSLAASPAGLKPQEPVAFVPVHPRTGPLWANTIPSKDCDRPAHYPLMDLYALPLSPGDSKSETAHPVVGLPCKDLPPALPEDPHYLQDTRCYVGNDMMFWAQDDGYTTDVSKARVFSRAVAYAQYDMRSTDLPWPKGYIDSKTRPAVDCQCVSRAEAVGSAIPNEGSQDAHATSACGGDDLLSARPTLRERCDVAVSCLPDAPYRASLRRLLDDLLASPVFGIIDPDYARVFTQARIVAWQYGYACVMHGSFTRDLDLLLVPWEDRAGPNGEQLLKLIADACGLHFRDGVQPIYKATVDWSDRPHGRKSTSLFFPAPADRRWVDISVTPCAAREARVEPVEGPHLTARSDEKAPGSGGATAMEVLTELVRWKDLHIEIRLWNPESRSLELQGFKDQLGARESAWDRAKALVSAQGATR